MSALDRYEPPTEANEPDNWRCFDCNDGRRCDIPGHEGVGYCKRYDEWFTSEDTAEEMGCL